MGIAFAARTNWDNPLRRSKEAGMTTCYLQCERDYNTRRSGSMWKRVGTNQILKYDEREDCYLHVHHETCTVKIYRDKYVVNVGGWDTPTTWAKIAEYCPIRTYRPRGDNIKHDRLVGWGKWDKTHYEHYAPFYNGIEVDGNGVPLKPLPVTIERVNKVDTAVFNANVRKVRSALRTRMLVGEWDDAPVRHLPTSGQVIDAFAKLAKIRGWIDTDLVAPLFMRSVARGEEDTRSCTERFNDMVSYARASPQLKETYEKECF